MFAVWGGVEGWGLAGRQWRPRHAYPGGRGREIVGGV